MHLHQRDLSDLDHLRQQLRTQRNAKARDRCRAVLLALEGQEAMAIAQALGRSRRFVQRWAYAYRDGGLAALAEQPRSGRPPKLSPPQLQALKARLDAGPQPADGVCSLRVRDVCRILEQEFGRPYSLRGATDLLHRLGYAYLQPRPRHRKTDPAAQAAWTQQAPLLSKA